MMAESNTDMENIWIKSPKTMIDTKCYKEYLNFIQTNRLNGRRHYIYYTKHSHDPYKGEIPQIDIRIGLLSS